MIMRRRLACCTRDREISMDFDEPEKIMTYHGLESCILNSQSYDNESGTSRGDGCVTDSFDEDDSSCSSSTNNFGSFSSLWTIMKKEDQCQDEWNCTASPLHSDVKEKHCDASGRLSDVETMKEKFAKILLGEDITGGTKGISTALALSNSISNLAASVFGELWKLEPLPEETKRKWKMEMDWLLAPTNHMIELVPAKQHGANGRMLEVVHFLFKLKSMVHNWFSPNGTFLQIMTPKARADIHMNLPALQKLDSMLIEMLDSMVGTEFWYAEVGSRAEGRSRSAGESQRWWLPSPRVPNLGLSDVERKRLLHQGKLVYQVFKAAKAINESVLDAMPIPTIIRDALSKSGRANVGEELYKVLIADSISPDAMVDCLYLKSEHNALEVVNKLEAAIFAWKEKIAEYASGKSPVRTSWTFPKDPMSELDKMEDLVIQAEVLLRQLRAKYPNLPHSFLDVTKIQYNKDVGHAVLEAYSRVLANLAFSIISRIGDILQEDVISNPNSPMAMSHLVGARIPGVSDSPMLDRVRHSLIHLLDRADSKTSIHETKGSDVGARHEEAKICSVNSTPSRRMWCIGGDISPRPSGPSSPK